MDDDESDDLDALEDPRITELGSDDEEAPKLVTKAEKKGKNKRSADEIDAATSLDDIMAKSLKSDVDEEPKLSKKQLKKLKKNNGESVPAKTEEAKKEGGDKKVQFAKNLEQGPTGSSEKAKTKDTESAKATPPKPATGVKVVGGVKIDDKKVGSGPACRNGQKVGIRYIGKLESGKVFDCKYYNFLVLRCHNADIFVANKKGKPFSFKVGAGEVIKGMDIGLVGMQVGGERRITIPSKLAYGSKANPDIPANSTLIFDLKLLELS
jgi:FK506-binding nuclear protein